MKTIIASRNIAINFDSKKIQNEGFKKYRL